MIDFTLSHRRRSLRLQRLATNGQFSHNLPSPASAGNAAVLEVRLMSSPAQFVLLPLLLIMSAIAAGQESERTATCAFDDGKQMSVRYTPVSGASKNPALGKVWTPGGSAMTVFTETDVRLGNTAIPTGAYTMYLIPGKKRWTLVVSKNTRVDATYDEKQDLTRVVMQDASLPHPADRLDMYFAHMGPKQCEINAQWGHTRAWVEFIEK
jgi:hypothetical protein